MFDLNAVRNSAAKGSPEEILHEAINLFRDFSKLPEEAKLKSALLKFFKYLQFEKTDPAPFFYISLSAYLLNDRFLAEKYHFFTQELAADFPYLAELELLIKRM